MPIKATPTPGDQLITPKDHTLILIDFQSQMAFATKSIDAIELRNNAGLIAHAAAGFKVPTVLTTVAEKSFSGPMFSEITDAFPGQELLWNKSQLAFTNNPEATKTIVRRQYREGFAPPRVG